MGFWSSLSEFWRDDIHDDWLGYDQPKKPKEIKAPNADKQEVVTAEDSVRRKKKTTTQMGGGQGQATIGIGSLYGL